MVPPNLKYWSISRIESVASQQWHAPKNRFLWALLCSNDKLNLECNWIMLIRKSLCIFDVCFIFELLFHPVRCTAWKTCQRSSKEKLVPPRASAFCFFHVNFFTFEVHFVSVNVHDNFQLVCISLGVNTNFFVPLYFVHFRQEVSSLGSFFLLFCNYWI